MFFRFAFLIVLIIVQLAFGELAMQVEPKEKECFYIYNEKFGKQITVDFFITRGGLLDLELIITDPMGTLFHKQLYYEKSSFTFTANTVGDYEVCFGNEMSRFTAKVVQFNAVSSQDVETDPVRPDTISSMAQRLRKVEANLNLVRNDQTYLRVREQKHRDTANSTNSRIQWFSIFESIVLLGISFGQVYYLRKFFDSKRPQF